MAGKIAEFVRFRRLADAIRGASRQFTHWSSQRSTDFLPDSERDRCLREAGITRAEFRGPPKAARGFRGRITAHDAALQIGSRRCRPTVPWRAPRRRAGLHELHYRQAL